MSNKTYILKLISHTLLQWFFKHPRDPSLFISFVWFACLFLWVFIIFFGGGGGMLWTSLNPDLIKQSACTVLSHHVLLPFSRICSIYIILYTISFESNLRSQSYPELLVAKLRGSIKNDNVAVYHTVIIKAITNMLIYATIRFLLINEVSFHLMGR